LYLLAHELAKIKKYVEGDVVSCMNKSLNDDELEVEESESEDFIGQMKEVDIDGFYVIKSGKCAIRHPPDNYIMSSIMEGDIFGESKLFCVRGFNHFGDIVVQSNNAEIWFISKKSLELIPKYDLLKIRENLVKNELRLYQLIIRYKNKYKSIKRDLPSN